MKKLFVAAAVLALSACSTLKTNTDFDPAVSFDQYKTYSWVEKKNQDASYHLDGLMDQRVRDAVNNELGQKGLTKADITEADLLVNYLTKVDKKINVDTFNTSFGYYPYYGRRGWGGAGMNTQTTVREYEVGTLIVDLIDNKTGNLVWRGSVADTIRNKNTPEERVQIINSAISQVMLNYPPQPETK
ncbi:hypothetical protein BCU94_09565 [Shewanella sp. 10N.286.52.C2]|uniref:DUF4136 domain-containing protein n=1 Tax=unclassified Shewanella TaxID=196818 RepID=UPI000C83BCCE|nr:MULTISPECIES: DUF4136 domain-containing protein [unclassified Shewanella]MDO6617594.1 DUF4136 domain-containing protein [Shewanella sp. 6_MG-2023]MDO6776615.1 DUF4136 domain-containing protein [Shewanella sp. 3_MG-2023]PMG31184.1 hypothetical protein BCU94_09565 [Shewanella sp. 10N.286.52.C2]PMI02852.1 hypothetical protein BCU55_04540 [Shewanella sp. 10N.286.48.A6]